MNGWSNEETYIIHRDFGEYLESFGDLTPKSVEMLVRDIYRWDIYRCRWPTYTLDAQSFIDICLRKVDWQELSDHYTGSDITAEGLVNE